MPPSNLLHTSWNTETLPTYTRDPETTSIRSSAPSYVSEVPSYHSNANFPPRPLPTPLSQPRSGLPRTGGNISNVRSHTYNIGEWSSATNGPRARHYEAVAARRATRAWEPSGAVKSHSPTHHHSPPPLASIPLSFTTAQTTLEQRAAAEEEALREEQKSWDFMVAQMADWKERESSWEGFRRGLEGGRSLGGKRKMKCGREGKGKGKGKRKENE